jgi:hypothetical protein
MDFSRKEINGKGRLEVIEKEAKQIRRLLQQHTS